MGSWHCVERRSQAASGHEDYCSGEAGVVTDKEFFVVLVMGGARRGEKKMRQCLPALVQDRWRVEQAGIGESGRVSGGSCLFGEGRVESVDLDY